MEILRRVIADTVNNQIQATAFSMPTIGAFSSNWFAMLTQFVHEENAENEDKSLNVENMFFGLVKQQKVTDKSKMSWKQI